MVSSRTLFSRRQKSAITACLLLSSLALSAGESLAQGQRPPTSQRPPQSFEVLPITITGVSVQDGQLVANGLVGTQRFTTPLTIAVEQQQAGECPILDLSLGPIDLNLLGLRVLTSPICLEVTAFEGGGLLGDLLCSVANLLQGGATLPDVVAQLQSTGQLNTFLDGLTTLLNQVFDRLTSNSALAGASCSVLSLELGPLNLNLLGLEVNLDDCSGGPVTLDITAIPGGGLLGDLLCSLSDLLSNNASPTAIRAVLFQISRLLGSLLG